MTIPLSRAQLCPEQTCQEIFHFEDGKCPRCGSDGLSLQRVLDERPAAAPLVEAVRALLVTGHMTRPHRRSLETALGGFL